MLNRNFVVFHCASFDFLKSLEGVIFGCFLAHPGLDSPVSEVYLPVSEDVEQGPLAELFV